MKHKDKIVFFDIDETLLPRDHRKIHIDVVEAIEELKQTGALPVIATGRTYALAKPYIEQLGINSYIVSDGQHIVFEGKDVYQKFLDADFLRPHIALLRSKKLPLAVETDDGLQLEEHPYAQMVVDKLERKEIVVKIVPNVEEIENVFNIWAFGDEDEITKLEESNFPETKLLRWHKQQVQIKLNGESKAKAAKIILDLTGHNIKDTYCFGDGINDLEIFQFVEHPVAMDNAIDSLKDIAKFTTFHCEADGIRAGLEKLNLIDKR